MSEHSDPEHRNELFALQFAIGSATNVVAAALGGIVARLIADRLGFVADGPDTYRIILVFMAVLLAAGLVVMLRLGDDRPSILRKRHLLVGRRARGLSRRSGSGAGRSPAWGSPSATDGRSSGSSCRAC